MSDARTIVDRLMAAALDEAKAHGISPDALARTLFDRVLKIYRDHRTIPDIQAELIAASENLDPDGDYTFMRP